MPSLRHHSRRVIVASIGIGLALAAPAAIGADPRPALLAVRQGSLPDGLPDAMARADVTRRATAGDVAPLGVPALPRGLAERGFLVINPVVANTDAAFAGRDRVDDGEPSIAVNPTRPQQIVLLTGRDGWEAWRKGGCVQNPSFCPMGPGNDKGSVWFSDDGGRSWTKSYDIPRPTGVDNPICTCDRVLAWAPDGTLFGAFLVGGDKIRIATTTNPFDGGAWTWPLGPDGKAVGLGTYEPLPVSNNETGLGKNAYTDQPWMVTAPDPRTPGTRNVFVSYANDATRGYDMRYSIEVAVSHGTRDPEFTTKKRIWQYPVCCDDRLESAQGFVPAGSSMTLRLAADERTGAVWALYGVSQAAIFTGPDPEGQAFDTLTKPVALVEQRLVRSTDGGRTWGLGGTQQGIVVDRAFSAEASNKFGRFNALFGGTHTAAVDTKDGSLHFVYGDYDVVTKRNRLAVRRVVADDAGNVTVGPKHYLTGQVDAGLPAAAVTADGTLGVLYDTHDGFDADGNAVVSIHLARSYDQGETFDDTVLLTFSSVEQENPNDVRQRPLGDYQQLLAVGNTFYGVSVANGAAFGRSDADWDPVYIRAPSRDHR